MGPVCRPAGAGRVRGAGRAVGGRPAGAALVVWYRYPRDPGKAAPAARPFHEQPNVLMTPHVSD